MAQKRHSLKRPSQRDARPSRAGGRADGHTPTGGGRPAELRKPHRATRGDAEALGDVVRELRRSSGLTQERLAFAASATKNYISDVEGARRNPTVRVLTQILDALGVSWADFGDAYDAARRGRRRP